ncbi:YceI family protein [Rhodospirillum sp. A1_3_36]|uniref:YceI family protein n=1 Tax=Rhodospirillum sp. A1_3_36 TaxID=3391666 RepID=UPI0039A71AC6
MIRASLTKFVLPLAFAVGLTATPALADVESYAIDKDHTSIVFNVNHMGFSTFVGEFTDFDGAISFDREDPSKSSVTFTIDMKSVETNVPKLDEHLQSADFFDVAKFPTATFKSTAIEVTGDNTAKITGDLSLHGVTKPVTLTVTLNKAAKHPFFDAYVAGFTGSATVTRTEFGIKTYAPAVGDQVDILINLEGTRQ